jgi:S-adenosylmethionine decarboxylase proenzyme
MFSEESISGKHMICDIKNIKNVDLLNSIRDVTVMFDIICNKYGFSVLNKIEHQFEPQGFTLLYLLSESHLSIHTFPEKNYVAIDLYTCKKYEDNSDYEEIYDLFIEMFEADRGVPTIIDRYF